MNRVLFISSICWIFSPGFAVEFNYSLLNLEEKNVVASLSEPGAILPGDYVMKVILNELDIQEHPVQIGEASKVCLSKALVNAFALKKDVEESVLWDDSCLQHDSLPGMLVEVNASELSLHISIPQAYLEYQSPSWDPVSRWDEGINGALFDYSLRAQHTINHDAESTSTVYSGSGVIGANIDAWRLRADWNAGNSYSSSEYGDDSNQSYASFNSVYAYKALPDWSAKLTVGEASLNTQVLDGFRFTGMKIESDDRMLPPELRGYSPEVVGVAKTNARVEIRQDGRLLYSSQVPQGPFRIQDIPNFVTGTLDVRVEEQDGSVQTFDVVTANIPYLTRPGAIRYNFAVGRPSDSNHNVEGPLFASSEFSWGVTNGWSLLGGAIASNKYGAVSLGFGRDLLDFGAISFDSTFSRATLEDGETKTGGSYRVNYSKSFDEYDSQVSFAGYRFSDRDYMSMSDFVNADDLMIQDDNSTKIYRKNKGMYNVTLSKHFRDYGFSAYMGLTGQSYWNTDEESKRYNLSISHTFDFLDWKNLNFSANLYSSDQYGEKDDGMYITLSMPLESGQLSYSNNYGSGMHSNDISYYNYNDTDNYSVTASTSEAGQSVNGYYTHRGDWTTVSVNGSHISSSSSSVGMSFDGGFTATSEGAAFHNVSSRGGSRMMVDTDGVSDIPVEGAGHVSHSNILGTAVIPDAASYQRTRVSVDITELNHDVDIADNAALTATLTEGAIGYKHFDVLSGVKRMAVIKFADGSFPPFGANVFNSKHVSQGIVGENGLVYLSGIKPGAEIHVRWTDKDSCVAKLPDALPSDDEMLTMLCSE